MLAPQMAADALRTRISKLHHKSPTLSVILLAFRTSRRRQRQAWLLLRNIGKTSLQRFVLKAQLEAVVAEVEAEVEESRLCVASF